MIILKGSAVENSNYDLDFINNGIDEIKKYPILYSILGDFEESSPDKYDNNQFLILASTSVYDIFLRGPNKNSIKELSDFEKLLSELNIDSFNSEKRESIKSKMRSFDINQNTSIIRELYFYKQLKENKNISDINYENIKDSTHDYKITLSCVEFNIELTGLCSNEFSQIVEDSFNQVANTCLSGVPKDTFLKLHIETNKLLNEDKKADKNFIVKKLSSDLKFLLPILFSKPQQYIRIESNFGGDDNSLYDEREILSYYNEFGENTLELTKTNEGINVLKNIKVKDLKNCSINSVTIFSSNTRALEIHSECSFPSPAETLRKIGLMGQLKRRIVDKIKKGQLKGQKCPFIAMPFDDWLFHDYIKDEYFGKEHYEELKLFIETIFIDEKEDNILGVFLFTDKISHHRFIQNPRIQIEKPILDLISSL